MSLDQHIRSIAEESGVDLDAVNARSNERQLHVQGHPVPVETWYAEDEIWMPWNAFIPGFGTRSGWTAREAADKCVAEFRLIHAATHSA